MVESRIHLFTWHKVMGLLIYALCLIGVIAPSTLLFIYFRDSKTYFNPSKNQQSAENTLFETINFSNESFFSEKSPSLPLINIKEAITYLGYSTRPDTSLTEAGIVVALNNECQPIVISPHKKQFFHYKDGKFALSDTPTPLSFTAHIAPDQKHLVLDVAGEFPTETCELSQIKQYYLKESTSFVRASLLSPLAKTLVDTLSSAKLFPPDKLFDLYGGEDFQDYKGKYRLQYEINGVKHILFVSERDLISISDNKLVTQAKKTLGKPLIRVESLTPSGCTLYVWDEHGYISNLLRIPFDESLGQTAQAFSGIKKVFKRTPSSVICHTEKKPIIVKQGDWLLKSKYGWRHLRGGESLRKFLSYDVKGEIFIFDGVKKVGDHSLFSGHYFNINRTISQAIEIPITESKKTTVRKRQKKPLSARIVPSDRNS